MTRQEAPGTVTDQIAQYEGPNNKALLTYFADPEKLLEELKFYHDAKQDGKQVNQEWAGPIACVVRFYGGVQQLEKLFDQDPIQKETFASISGTLKWAELDKN